jgi:hypothetical protein
MDPTRLAAPFSANVAEFLQQMCIYVFGWYPSVRFSCVKKGASMHPYDEGDHP